MALFERSEDELLFSIAPEAVMVSPVAPLMDAPVPVLVGLVIRLVEEPKVMVPVD